LLVRHTIKRPMMAELCCNETPQKSERRGGRPRADNPIIGRTIGLPAELWAYLELWDGPNLSQKTVNALECLRLFAPGGFEFNKPRDGKGRFLPIGGEREAERRRRLKEGGEG